MFQILTSFGIVNDMTSILLMLQCYYYLINTANVIICPEMENARQAVTIIFSTNQELRMRLNYTNAQQDVN